MPGRRRQEYRWPHFVGLLHSRQRAPFQYIMSLSCKGAGRSGGGPIWLDLASDMSIITTPLHYTS